MVSLCEITKQNFWDCIDLEVSEGQREYVTSNAVSLAQSGYQPECIPLGIFSDGEMAGFAMYCIDADDGEYWIYRMMIDSRFQGRGYGKKALELLEAGKKIQIEYDVKNSILKIFELKIKRIQIGGIEQ